MRVFGSFYQYDSYLQQRVADFPLGREPSFDHLQEWIADDFSVVFQGLFRELGLLKEIEASAWTLPNCNAMQICWAKENHFIPENQKPTQSIFLEQLRRFRPDVFLAFGYPLDCSFLETVKKEIPTIRLIAGWDGRRIHDPDRFRGADIIFSCLDETVDFYQSNGFRAYYLPYFFDTDVLRHLPNAKKAHRVVFPGSIHISSDGHNDRLRLIRKLLELPEFEPYLDLGPIKNWRVWAGMIKRGDFSHVRTLRMAIRRNQPSVYGLDMFRLLAESLVSANVHIDAAGTFAGNIRLFEATGVGSCLLTDKKRNLSSFFSLDTEIVEYHSPEDALEKARWLIDHPSIAQELGSRSARRVKTDHSAAIRATELLSAIQSAIKIPTKNGLPQNP